MRVATRLRIVSSITIAAIILLTIALAGTFVAFKSAKSDLELADGMLTTLFRMESLRNQFFLYREDRVRLEWERLKEITDRLQDEAKGHFQDEDAKLLLEKMRRNTEARGAIFRRIVENTAALTKGVGVLHVYEELDKRLYSQLLLKAAAFRDLATELRDASARRVDLTYQTLTFLVGSFAFSLALFTIVASMQLGSFIRRRLLPLHFGAKTVADGDLDYRVKYEGSDEFSDLALSVNTMTDKLQMLTKQLEAKVLERTIALSDERDTAQGYLDIAGVMLMALDRDGRITMINRKGEQLLGKPESAIIGMDWFETFLPAEERHRTRVGFDDWLSGEKPLPERFESRIVNALGEELILAWNNRLLQDKTGVAVGTLSSAEDVTERIRAEAAHALLEAELRESQKMQAIGTLAGGIAHDFNNILATILGNTALARQEMNTSKTAMESLNEIHKAGNRARDLVQQILSFSRRQPTERKLVALAPIIEESTRLLRATLPARLRLEFFAEANVPRVLADATQVKQIVINIVTNAMQAIRSGPGCITIRLDTALFNDELVRTHPVLHAMYVNDVRQAARVRLSDTGPGMDTATIARVFEPFFTTKPVDEGTGLGLSVVHGIVQTHGGAITVESRLGEGTEFAIYLPADQEFADAADKNTNLTPSPMAEAERSAQQTGQRILYLDDDESLVFLVERLLERQGYFVSGYSDQQEALDALSAEPNGFDLVVTDYNMPGMSGLDVARSVRAIRADLPVAIASGFIDETLVAESTGAGVCELIFKANAAEELCDAFARLAQLVSKKSIAQ